MFAGVFFSIQTYAIVFSTTVMGTWQLVGAKWVSNILSVLTILSLLYLVGVAINGIQI